MKLPRPARKPPLDPVVPLVDIVFFLLVFFLLVGRYDATAPWELVPARAEAGTDLEAGGAQVFVAPGGEVALGRSAMTLAALLRALEDLRAAQPDLRIAVHAGGEVELGAVQPVLAALEGAGFGRATLVVEKGP